jgi:hypothetical protein
MVEGGKLQIVACKPNYFYHVDDNCSQHNYHPGTDGRNKMVGRSLKSIIPATQ